MEEFAKPEEAEALLRDAWTFDRAKLPVNHPRLMDSALLFANHLTKGRRFVPAEAVLRELLDRYRSQLPKQSWRTALVEMRLGSVLAAQRKFDESERLMLQANATLALGFDPPDSRVAESRAHSPNCTRPGASRRRQSRFGDNA